jgi:hypothetical protein
MMEFSCLFKDRLLEPELADRLLNLVCVITAGDFLHRDPPNGCTDTRARSRVRVYSRDIIPMTTKYFL